MVDFAALRRNMVEWQIARRGISDARVLDAMASVPREAFVAPELAPLAYEDCPLSIGYEQTISQPYIVALMASAAAIRPSDRVLEVGTGSGYAAAVLSCLAAEVFTIERHVPLASEAARVLTELGYRNVKVRAGDGTLGWPDAQPFDAILVAAASRQMPTALRAQLAIGGRLVMPVGPERSQSLLRVCRLAADRYETDDFGPVRFVPLVSDA